MSSGTKKDAELIGRTIKHKNNAEPKTNRIQRHTGPSVLNQPKFHT